MLSVKLVRSLVLGETMINNPFLHHHHHHNNNDEMLTQVEYDADDDDDETQIQKPRIKQLNNNNNNSKFKNKNKKKMPLLLFIPTQELISDTFRLATIARDIGMNFYPSPTLSHLLFSWPSSSASTSTSSFSPISPLSFASSSNNRPSVSSSSNTASTSTSGLSLWGNTIPNDSVPLPFPSLSTSSSISLLRYFVSLSKNLFKLVFLEIEPNSRFNYSYNYNFDSSSSNVCLISRVSGKQVNSMEDFSRVLAGNGWSLFRSSENKKTSSSSSSSAAVYLFSKKDWNRIRAEKMINGGNGECRIRELRLPALDFKNGVPLRILQYILLMTDDLFYLA